MNLFLTSFCLLATVWLVGASSAPSNQKSKKVVLDKYGNHNWKSHMNQPCGPPDGHDLRKESRFFLPASHGTVDEPVTFSSQDSISSFYSTFKRQCVNDTAFTKLNRNMYRMQWRYKLYESLHCLRVELDLGNITHFKKAFNYGYYQFSYREIGKKNIFLKRQPIDEEVNRLIIRHANLRPYIICISFYKDDIDKYDAERVIENGNDTEEATTTSAPVANLTCQERSALLLQDVPVHDLAMCVDIDTPEHFLEVHKHALDYKGFNPELIMVLFIVALLIFMLLAISIINWILIEKPLEKKRKRLRQFIQRKLNSSADHSANLVNSRDSLSRNNSKLQLAKEPSPAIVVSDFSSNKSLQTSGSQGNEEPKETDGLLMKAESSVATPSLLTTDSTNTPSTSSGLAGHKVTFHIGETILEEPAQSEPAPAVAEESTAEPNDESIKSVSHLLDDKPWFSSSNLNSGVQARQSRSNSFAFNPIVSEIKEGKK